MTITAIKDFRIKQRYTRLVEKALVGCFWDLIYKPIFQIAELKNPKAINALTSYNHIIEGLKKGLIFYTDGGFKAKTKFSNLQSLALEKWGARWSSSQRMYKIEKHFIPIEVLSVINQLDIEAQSKINHIEGFVNYLEDNLDSIVDTMVFDNEVVTILDDAGNEIKKNVKKVTTIEVNLTQNQKEQIAKTYTENMQFYVKDWTQERITEMRKKVQEIVLAGYRPEMIQKMLETEYGIASRKAKFLAQNETTIMLSAFKKAKYQEMGFDKFIWHTIIDGKERELHKQLNNTTWSFDDPPIIDERTGERGLPGQTYNCRCEMTPFRDSTLFGYSNTLSRDESESKLDKYLGTFRDK